MSRIIIQNNSSQSDYNAIKHIMSVINDGRISGGNKCYCYISIFPKAELLIAADLTRSGNDKFIVQDHKEAA